MFESVTKLALLLRRLHELLEEAVDLHVLFGVHERRRRTGDRDRRHALDQRGDRFRLRQSAHGAAIGAAPCVEVAQRRDHHRAADLAHERLLVDPHHPLARDVYHAGVEAGRVDQLRLEQLAQLGSESPSRSIASSTTRTAAGLRFSRRGNGRARARRGRGATAAHRAERLLEVLGGGRDVHALLGEPQLQKRVHAGLLVRGLRDRAPEVANRRLGGAADERAVGREPQGPTTKPSLAGGTSTR